MLDSSIKSKIDGLWNSFWSGGISNPLTVIEQMSYLIFIKKYDDKELEKEKTSKGMGKTYESVLKEEYRWHVFRNFNSDKLFTLFTNEIFPFMKKLTSKYLEDAIFLIQKPSLLYEAILTLDSINLSDSDIKGDLYEYLISKLSTSGVNGQFRTPRHIIRMMVELLDPGIDDKIIDPACGTAGFLVGSLEYILEKYTDKTVSMDGEDFRRIGDLLSEDDWEHFNEKMFFGNDFDKSMLRIASMNLDLHGVSMDNIRPIDSLSSSFEEENMYSLVLANPPFKGSLDENDINKSLVNMVRTKKTELLFLALMYRILDMGGKCACIVPDGVLFGSSKAHKDIRRILIEDCELQGVVSMPSGIFKPYAGVSTAVLLFQKGGETRKVWFYDMEADGYTLDDKRTPVEQNDIPDIVGAFKNCMKDKNLEPSKSDKWFFVDKGTIVENGYDLSINKYKEVEYEEKIYEDPKVKIKRILELEEEIIRELRELEGMIE
ncbi:MAG: type I restriction-modification system subunit M [Oscillospiraceae bacterium]|nr:type I restriction-modification system subunit M [Oscillospiraceae bacterium]